MGPHFHKLHSNWERYWCLKQSLISTARHVFKRYALQHAARWCL